MHETFFKKSPVIAYGKTVGSLDVKNFLMYFAILTQLFLATKMFKNKKNKNMFEMFSLYKF
jgi:hypothetical protein